MIEQRVYTPTNYIEKTVVHSVIFLAGPIQGAVDWQSTAIELIKKENPHIIVANPRRRCLDGEFDYEAQVDWETFHLRRAGENGVIMFWLPKETDHDHNRAYAQTSRVELGEWKVRHERDGVDLVIGIFEEDLVRIVQEFQSQTLWSKLALLQ